MICTNFDVYNERVALKEAIENNKQHTGHFSECILVDQICWKRDNSILYNKLEICLSGKWIVRLRKVAYNKAEKKSAYQDNT